MRRSFKARYVCAAAAMSVVGFSQLVRADNLLINPSFESPPDTTANIDSFCAGWTFQFDCQRATFHASENPTGGTWDIWAKTFEPLGGGIMQTFNNGFTAGGNYSLSSKIYFEPNFFTQSGSTIQMQLNWQDASGNPVGTPTALNIDSTNQGTLTTGTWTPFNISGIAPAGSAQVQVFLGWSGGTSGPGGISAFFDNADLEGPGAPPPPLVPTWATDVAGDWNLASHWSSGTVPNGVGAEADLMGVITANRTVFSDSAITVGSLIFNNSHTYVLAGAGSLTLQAAGAASAQVQVQAGTQEINLPTTIASNTIFNVSPGATLIVADPVTINTGKAISQTGGGTVIYQSIVNVQGGAGIAFGNSTHAHELDIAATGTASISGSGSTLTVDTLSNSGKLDVKNNKMIVAYGTGADPASSIKSQLTSGYNGGAWNGNGINSSLATQRIGVGWKDDTTAKAVTVKYTYDGDTNLDGAVNTADFTSLAQHFNASGASAIWLNGDFNYDGKVNALDFNAVATNFGATPIPASALGALVPEPVSALLLIPLGALVGARRRR